MFAVYSILNKLWFLSLSEWGILYLDLQLPVKSVPITTNVVSLNPAHGEVFDTT